MTTRRSLEELKKAVGAIGNSKVRQTCNELIQIIHEQGEIIAGLREQISARSEPPIDLGGPGTVGNTGGPSVDEAGVVTLTEETPGDDELTVDMDGGAADDEELADTRVLGGEAKSILGSEDVELLDEGPNGPNEADDELPF